MKSGETGLCFSMLGLGLGSIGGDEKLGLVLRDEDVEKAKKSALRR